jgi:hypothetical protein
VERAGIFLLGWIIVGSIALIFLLILITPISISLFYGRIGENDHVAVEVTAWFRLIRWKYELPIVKLTTSRNGPELVARVVKTGARTQGNQEEVKDVTGREIQKWRRAMQDFLERVENLQPVLKQMMKRIRCTRLEWHTSLGLGGAAETGALIGVAWGVKSALIGVFSHGVSLRTVPRLSVQPHWNRQIIRTQIRCDLHFWLGHALIAGLRILFRLRKDREPKWQTTTSGA